MLLRRQNGAVWAVTDCLSDEKSPVLAWDDRHQQVRIIFFSERYIETLRHPEVTLSKMLSAVTTVARRAPKGSHVSARGYPIHLLGRLLARGLQQTPITEIARGGARTPSNRLVLH